jgi:hypothetical protein
LELAAIDPFIALLPLEDQQKFKLEMARRSFAQENLPIKVEKSPATTLDLLRGSKELDKMLEIILEAIKKLPKTS